tara:strand:+ start:885 stop:1271 length:387 start_codon:yes stop_codon:yes gene_type:complete
MCSRNKKQNASSLIFRYFNKNGEWIHRQEIDNFYYDLKFSGKLADVNTEDAKLTYWFSESQLKKLLKEDIYCYINDGGLNNDEHPFNELYSVGILTWQHRKNKQIISQLKKLADEENQEMFDKRFPSF